MIKKIKGFVFKALMYLILFGLPLSIIAFLVAGVVWVIREMFK
jgi:TM2 domain-containing membrane protein YozV